ncbi:MAG: UDP-2,3-diacylglucosamine diphosphatase [Candidatus Eisenbacteria bacterium]
MRAPAKAYFIADAHFGANRAAEKTTVPALLSLLDTVKTEGAGLYILGDLFDFWFEFRHAVPKIHVSVLAKLYELRDAGCPLGFAGGNHDFWMGEYLRRELGADVSADWLECRLQGRKTCMSHGDGLVSGDLGYKILKKMLRSRLNVGLYRLIHPDVGVPFALLSSRLSRKTSVSKMKEIADALFREVALGKFAEGFDLVILGHVHMPFHRTHEGREFYVVGDWIENLSYLVMENGRLKREAWGSRQEARS